MQAEIAALHHQLRILQRRTGARPRLRSIDRILWTWLSRLWSGWRRALVIVKPETVLAWHRRGFQLYWRWKSRKRGPGRPKVSRDVRALIRKMSLSNPGWGAPRIHGELLKLGIDIGQTSVGQYMVRCRRPPSQTWRTFLDNHLRQLVAVDFFVVPTLTFRVLFVFVVLAHDRRRILHFNVTSHPTAEWTAQQIREAFLFIQEIAQRYEKAAKITLVMDNLNTHGPGSLYETLVPGEAKALWDRFELSTPPSMAVGSTWPRSN